VFTSKPYVSVSTADKLASTGIANLAW